MARARVRSVRLKRGGLGDIVIGDTSFDIARGTLFLVCTKKGKMQAEQLMLDNPGLSLDVNGISRLAKTKAEIRRFFDEKSRSSK